MGEKMKKYTGEEAKKLWKKGMKWGCFSVESNPRKEDINLCTGTPSFTMPAETYFYTLDIPEKDDINNPSHYYVTIDGKSFDCRAVQRELGMYEHHCIASAFAYLWRCLHKENTLKDLEKAVNFLNEEIAYRHSLGEK